MNRGGGGGGGSHQKERQREKEQGGEPLLSFITCNRKSAVNCLPIAYHLLLVTRYPPPPPPPSRSPSLPLQSILSLLYHLSLIARCRAQQKDIS